MVFTWEEQLLSLGNNGKTFFRLVISPLDLRNDTCASICKYVGEAGGRGRRDGRVPETGIMKFLSAHQNHALISVYKKEKIKLTHDVLLKTLNHQNG